VSSLVDGGPRRSCCLLRGMVTSARLATSPSFASCIVRRRGTPSGGYHPRDVRQADRYDKRTHSASVPTLVTGRNTTDIGVAPLEVHGPLTTLSPAVGGSVGASARQSFLASVFTYPAAMKHGLGCCRSSRTFAAASRFPPPPPPPPPPPATRRTHNSSSLATS
jgi:hypothetical protein